MLESLKGWIIDPNTQAQKTIENYENQRLSIEDAIESGLLNNRAGQIFLDYGDVIMGPPVTLPSSLVDIRDIRPAIDVLLDQYLCMLTVDVV